MASPSQMGKNRTGDEVQHCFTISKEVASAARAAVCRQVDGESTAVDFCRHLMDVGEMDADTARQEEGRTRHAARALASLCAAGLHMWVVLRFIPQSPEKRKEKDLDPPDLLCSTALFRRHHRFSANQHSHSTFISRERRARNLAGPSAASPLTLAPVLGGIINRANRLMRRFKYLSLHSPAHKDIEIHQHTDHMYSLKGKTPRPSTLRQKVLDHLVQPLDALMWFDVT
ncbi:hypothetical protein F2P81_002281 [Scophthalmus maximus]|uniref:Uncharacterized protein n=1 Tax=Scophthalmus maximus TaxID=52904 RepID=A0A6A4TUR8_SCOMX|nr:hypothetical protein F2P81_002281 [Scophthalmus maximus]